MQSENGGMTIMRLLLFSALPGGYRNNDGNFNNICNNGNWWSATENDASNAYNRNLNYNNENLNKNNNNKGWGFSVRLLRDLKGKGKPHGCVSRDTLSKGYQAMYADVQERINKAKKKSKIARHGRLYKRNGPMEEVKKNKPALELTQQTHGGSALLHPNFAPFHCAKLRHASNIGCNTPARRKREERGIKKRKGKRK